MKGALYRGEKVYATEKDWRELIGNGKAVHACGDVRLLSRTPPPPGDNRRSYSAPFEDSFETISRSEWSARIKEQLDTKARISDFETWPALDQNGTPQCWSNGVAGAAATVRVMQGLPYIQLSPASVAVPISGGTSGGYEGDAVRYGKEHGWAPSKIFPQHSTDRSLCNDQKVVASRPKFMLLEVFDLGNDFDKLISALLMGMPCAAAWASWSHVTEVCDPVELSGGEFAVRMRNSWGEGFGAKNEHGVGGYAVFPEHGPPHGRAEGIFALRQLTVHAGAEYAE